METDAGLAGLGIFSDERTLFPDELVSPHVGLGWGSPSGPKHVVSYQLNVNDCPNLSEDNRCKVYDKRPLVCQAFPLRLSEGREPHNASGCSFMKEVGKDVDSLKRLRLTKLEEFMGRKELQAINEMNKLIDKSIIDHPMDARVIWVFDLKNKEWHVARVDV